MWKERNMLTLPGTPGGLSIGHQQWAACCRSRLHTQPEQRWRGPGYDAEKALGCWWAAAAAMQALCLDPPDAASLWTHAYESRETWEDREDER